MISTPVNSFGGHLGEIFNNEVLLIGKFIFFMIFKKIFGDSKSVAERYFDSM